MRKRILFLIPSLSIGGAERVLINLLKKIEYNKYDITICLFGYYGEYLTEVPKGVKVISIFNNSFLARVFTFLQRKLRISFLLMNSPSITKIVAKAIIVTKSKI